MLLVTEGEAVARARPHMLDDGLVIAEVRLRQRYATLFRRDEVQVEAVAGRRPHSEEAIAIPHRHRAEVEAERQPGALFCGRSGPRHGLGAGVPPVGFLTSQLLRR